MISIKNLSLAFSTHKVLDNISVDFHAQFIHGVVGINGAGKTTFFNTLAGLNKIYSGEIKLNDNILSSRQVAYLETVNFFYSRITGNEYLQLFKQSNERFNLPSLQQLFKLPLDELIENYSTGMKKKLACLAILKQDREVFILDEPFNGLDLESTKILELIIIALKEKGKTVIISSHIIDPLINLCDSIHILENGRFIKEYDKSNYHELEEELFGKLKTEAIQIIREAI